MSDAGQDVRKGTGREAGRASDRETGQEPGKDAGTHPERAPRGQAHEPEQAREFALPLVVRLERGTPPHRTDALETAARAVLTLLADERSADGGEWSERVRSWEDTAIRKVVRRARGAEWRRAEALPGITVTGRTAEVRVFPPVPVGDWPRDLARLQVSGTELTDPEPPPAPAPAMPVMWLAPDLEMSAGKAMAQAAHGAQLAWWRLPDAARKRWREADFALAVRTASGVRQWSRLLECGLPVVRDAGYTEVAAGSVTVVADFAGLLDVDARG
ncbi:peptidyl-tRNA hydrolase [Streptomyces sp. HNM0575]|uniref:peptidyl-tRNA hydrolase n=1 Tax=Streptomyces sp. HNM0575 TaxID=2716338 RepID=UPI00145D3315|nr:peptidyl-tRNA hydrolase [Streptomyces sp. HNM0575]